jgi:glutamate synthase (NADPH/NADH) large chain
MNGIPLPKAVMMTDPGALGQRPAHVPLEAGLLPLLRHHDGALGRPRRHRLFRRRLVGAVLDRNGLRPAAGTCTDDDTLASPPRWACWTSAGAHREKIPAQPGRMLLVDTVKGRAGGRRRLKSRRLRPAAALRRMAGRDLVYAQGAAHRPKSGWPQYSPGHAGPALQGLRLHLRGGQDIPHPAHGPGRRRAHLRHGRGYAAGGAQSEKHQPLFSYFKQLFAQVTNPPIDAIREEIVTDTTVYVGSRRQSAPGAGGKLPRAADHNPSSQTWI